SPSRSHHERGRLSCKPVSRQSEPVHKWLSEPPNAWVKSVLGFRQFSMRGLAKAQAEWKLVCAALNLRRMAKMTFA
ncbi:transposase, partial [Caballeronia choica]|uniref:transposase n=1 Tax=Caballeronia choica TaxID=326476 RepID=UPI000B2EF82E